MFVCFSGVLLWAWWPRIHHVHQPSLKLRETPLLLPLPQGVGIKGVHHHTHSSFFCWFLLSVCLFYLLRKKINAYVSKISENKEGDYFIYMNHMDLLINLILQIF